ncbi:MAG: response regulator [Ideonella sp.]|nr:response regulator [Ideonella sp.]MCC7457682.1 response regulator [Nitrospira sp.]
MPSPHRVCLLGFGDFERRALALQFGLASSRTPAYELVAAPEQARYLLVDGDAPSAVQRAVSGGRVGDALFVGTRTAPAGALAALRRPIDALSLLRELDAAVLRGQPPAPSGSAAAAPLPAAAVEVQPGATLLPLEPPLRPVASCAVPRADTSVDAMAPTPRPGPSPESPGSRLADLADWFPDRVEAPKPGAKPKDTRCDALLVDDSEIALRFLEIKLGELGLRSRTATTSDDALAQLAQHDFTYVFVDVELGQHSRMDGLALCRHIKRAAHNKRAPLVALVSAHASQTDRVRGSLAGCDAYLGKPLAAHELAAVVSLRRMR